MEYQLTHIPRIRNIGFKIPYRWHVDAAKMEKRVKGLCPDAAYNLFCGCK